MATFPLPKVNWPIAEDSPTEISYLGWEEFQAQWTWNQGEHVSLIGPTGQGKTTLGMALLPRRSYVVVMATKPKDATLDVLKRRGYKKTEEWPPSGVSQKVILWPPYKRPEYEKKQQQVFAHAMDDIFGSGGWCVFVDEAAYFVDDLKLEKWLKRFWRQGRSLGISLVAATQRPAWIPLDIYSAASHLFLWGTNDPNDLQRLGGIAGGVDVKKVRETVSALKPHEVLYVDTRTRFMCRTRLAL